MYMHAPCAVLYSSAPPMQPPDLKVSCINATNPTLILVILAVCITDINPVSPSPLLLISHVLQNDMLVPQQGMGTFVNGCVILIAMAIFGQTGSRLSVLGSRNVIILQFAVGAAVAVLMVLWRYTKLRESKVCNSHVTLTSDGWCYHLRTRPQACLPSVCMAEFHLSPACRFAEPGWPSCMQMCNQRLTSMTHTIATCLVAVWGHLD